MEERRVKVWVQRFKDRPTLVLQWIDPETGRRKSKSARTADEKKAEEARADLESDLNHGRYSDGSEISWEDFRERFDDEYAAFRRPGSQDRYGRALDQFEALCHPKKLRNVTAKLLTTYAAELRKMRGQKAGSKRSPVTVAYCLNVVRIALRWAVRQGYLQKLPEFPDIPVPRKGPPIIPTETVERLLAAARGDRQMHAFLLCAWLAGLRLGEALELEREPSDAAPWIDAVRGRIWLPAEFVKGNADQWVPLDPVLREALESVPGHGRKVFRFTKPDGSPLKRSGIIARVARLCHKAGVRLSMKALRKAFGSWYAPRVPAQVLQKLMRHSDIAITMGYYANVDDAVEAAVQGRRNSLCNTAPEKATEAAAADPDNIALANDLRSAER
jgi:integrase